MSIKKETGLINIDSRGKGMTGLTKLSEVVIPGGIVVSSKELEENGKLKFPKATHYDFIWTKYKTDSVKIPVKYNLFGITMLTLNKTEKQEKVFSLYHLLSEN